MVQPPPPSGGGGGIVHRDFLDATVIVSVCVFLKDWQTIFIRSFAGFDAVTVANNHLNDFGSKGVNFTVEVLQKTGMKYFGISYGKYDTSQVL